MRQYRQTRRQIVKTLISGSCLTAFAPNAVFSQVDKGLSHHNDDYEPRDDILISSADDNNGHHYVVRYHTLTGKLKQWPIEHRGHGSQVTHDNQFSLMMARRPGTKAYIQSLEFNDKPFEFNSRVNRHFYGHAVYADNGRYLLTTENDYKNQHSVIGVRDAFDNYKWIDEIDAYGVGGHELALLNDGKTLVVANGGIITHPNTPRKKLNLGSMDSSLVYLDIASGKLLDEYVLEEPQMSIRHLDVSDNNEVVIACQHQSQSNVMMPMMYFHQGESELQAARLDDDYYWLSYQNYTASVCQHNNHTIAISSPRGDKISFWNRKTKRLLKEHHFRDVSGIAVSRDEKYFIATSGRGDIRYYNAMSLEENSILRQRINNLHWDNHLTVI